MNTLFSTLFSPRKWGEDLTSFALSLGLLLLLIDGLFLVLHLALNFGYLADRRFHIEVDSGFAEQFQYLKFTACSLLLFVVATKTRSLLRLVLGLLLGFLLLEDAAGIHEDIHLLGEQFITIKSTASLSKVQAWELIYGLLVGGGLIGLLLIAIFRSQDVELRQRALLITFLILVLGGFGVVVDFGHALLQGNGTSHFLESFVGLVEDFGEMVTTSLIAALVIDDAVQTLSPETSMVGQEVG